MTAEERLRATLDSLLDPHIVLEAVRGADDAIIDFTYVDANPAACDYNKRTRQELLGLRVLDLFPKQISYGLMEMYSRALSSGDPLVLDDFQYDNEMHGGRWYDVRAVRIGRDLLSYTWRDVTDRHLAAERIRESEERFRVLSDNASDVVLALDCSGRIEWASSGVRSVLGRDQVDVVGTAASDLIYFADHAGLCAQHREVRASGHRGSRARVAHAGGKLVWMEVRLTAGQAGAGDGYRGVVLSMRDIDAEVRAEEAMQSAARERERSLVVADQLRIARDLHDRVIQGIFACGLSLTASARRTDDVIARESMVDIADRLDAVIRELRTSIFDFSRGGAVAPLTRRVLDLVEGVAQDSSVTGIANFRGSVDAAVPDDLGREVTTVVHELLNNVVKHARAENCQVSIDVTDGQNLVIQVRDDGRFESSVSHDERCGTTSLSGHGLVNLRVRAESRGGSFSTTPMPHGGLLADWRVPLTGAAA